MDETLTVPTPPAEPGTVLGLTLEQKAALLTGRDFWSTLDLPEHDVPSLVLTDGPHGIRRQQGSTDHLGLNASMPATCFPPAVAVGASWDVEVAELVGAAVGREARALGVHVALGPGINIKRTPLCGRNFEYYSEDPFLTGVLAAAHVHGQQAQGVGASVKHFAANNQETDRMQVSVEVDERTLREIYLPAFERVVTDAHPATVMCSYNRLNGVHASQHPWLLTQVLREEWGFNGVVVSDWGAVHDRVAALQAGLDLEMPASATSAQQVTDAVRAGRLDEAVVDRSVARCLHLTHLAQYREQPFDVDGHHALARDLAADCAVLLKNDGGLLPLDPRAHVAVLGVFAAEPRFQGGGSSHINATRMDTALEVLREAVSDAGGTVSFASGFALDTDEASEQLREEAVQAARAADVAVVFVGLGESDESEGFDRDALLLPANQLALLRDLAAQPTPVVVVLSHGGVVSLEGWIDQVPAVLDGALLGQAGGAALADLLLGRVNPSGHLAETIPLRLEDTPAFVNFPGEQGVVRYGEGVMVGYRWYETVQRPVRYPFGHGLSYTTFSSSDLRCEVTGPDTAEVTVIVMNTGDRAGKHVVQVYVATSTGPVKRPERELRAFTKVTLAPGESREVRFELPRRAFAYYDVKRHDWVVPGGPYAVQVCRDAATVLLEQTIELAGDVLSQPLTLESTLGEWVGHPIVGPTLMDEIAAALPEGQRDSVALSPDLLKLASSMPMGKILAFLGGSVPEHVLDRLMERSAQVPERAP